MGVFDEMRRDLATLFKVDLRFAGSCGDDCGCGKNARPVLKIRERNK
jgi:hypothetical protein